MIRHNAKLNLLISMLIFGTVGIFVKSIPASSSVVIFFRGILGMIFLLILNRFKIKHFSDIKDNLIKLILSGIFLGVNWLLLFVSYNYIPVSTATLCYYMAPIFVVALSPFIFKEKMTIKKIICIIITFIGGMLVFGVFDNKTRGVNNLYGIILGLGAALFYALVVILNKKITCKNPYDKTIIQLGISALVMIPFVINDFYSITFSIKSVILLIIVGVIHTGIAYALYFSSLDKLNSFSISIMSYIDPVVAVLLSALILKENLTLNVILGAIMIIASSIISEVQTKKIK